MLFVLAACSNISIRVENPRTLSAAAGSDAAVYLVLNNLTFSDVTFLGATSDVARSIEIHRSALISGEDREAMENGGEYHYEPGAEEEEDKNGLTEAELGMPMAAMTSIRITTGHEIELEPEYAHLMLIDLQRDLQVGDHFTLILHFENYADLPVEVQVVSDLN